MSKIQAYDWYKEFKADRTVVDDLSHSAQFTQEHHRIDFDSLIRSNVHTMPQAPYSPDLASCDFFLFPRLRVPLRRKRFETIEAIKENSQKELRLIPKMAYEKWSGDWRKRWNMCIACNGDYFEGNQYR